MNFMATIQEWVGSSCSDFETLPLCLRWSAPFGGSCSSRQPQRIAVSWREIQQARAVAAHPGEMLAEQRGLPPKRPLDRCTPRARDRRVSGAKPALANTGQALRSVRPKILLGILPLSEGQALYGGIPICQLGLAKLRRRIGTDMRDDVLLTGSLTDNMSFLDLSPERERIEACAKLA